MEPEVTTHDTVTARFDRSNIVAVVYHLLGNREAAEDITSDAVVALLEHDGEIRDVGAWLRTVAYRRALNELRRQQREHAATIRLTDLQPPPHWEVELHDHNQAEVAEAVAQLPNQQRAAALLHWGDDLPVNEVARIMGCAAPTVRVHLYRARRRLRDATPNHDAIPQHDAVPLHDAVSEGRTR